MMGRICNLLHGLKPALLMVVVQIVFAGINVFYKLAAFNGMSLRIMIAYRFMFATAFTVPAALVIERNSRPKLTWTVVFQAFLCGLFGGSLAQNLYIESLVLTSATFAAATTNLVPAITFILAISVGLEKMVIRTKEGKAKVLGTLMGIGGAMLLTFYKGAEIDIWSTNVDLLRLTSPHVSHVAYPHHGSRLMGCLLAVGSGFCYAAWLIIQAKMSGRYPCPYSSTALMSIMGAIQATVFALCMEKDWSQWKLGWDIRLLSVAYSGILGSGLMVTLIAWCVRMRGPLFVSIFNPLMLVLVALAGSFLLDEKLHLGTILGGSLIVLGLYSVLWGKGKEMKKITQLVPSNTSAEAESVEIVITSSIDNSNNTENKETIQMENGKQMNRRIQMDCYS